MSFSMDADDINPTLPEAVPLAPVSAIRFCKTCGTPWSPEWTDCPHCAGRAGRHVLAEQAQHDFKLDVRRVKSATALYFSLLAVSIVSIIVMTVRGENDKSEDVVMIAGVFMSIITLGWCIGSRGTVWPLVKQPPQIRYLVIGALSAVPTLLIAHGAVTLLHKVLGVDEVNYLDGFFAEGWGWTAAIVTICVQPAIFEELAFRGVIMSALEPVIGVAQAVVVSSLMFAILHLAIPSIPHLFIMGLVFAWLRLRTGSLYAGMIAHFTHNLLVLLTEHYGGLIPW